MGVGTGTKEVNKNDDGGAMCSGENKVACGLHTPD